jgi:hypothetical protein
MRYLEMYAVIVVRNCQTVGFVRIAEGEVMMNHNTFRWIAFAVSCLLALIIVIAGSVTGFLCFLVSAFLLFPLNTLLEKLDTTIDPEYRKRATIATTAIFFVCGILSFTTIGYSHDGTDTKEQGETTTTAITTVTTVTTTETEIDTTTTEATTKLTTEKITEAPQTEVQTDMMTTEAEEVVAQSAGVSLILNTETNCVHVRSNCSAAESILPENYREITIPEDELSDYAGVYWACGKCAKKYSEELPKF